MKVKCKKVRAKSLNKATVKSLWLIMYITLALSLASEFLVEDYNPHFKVESFPFFNAIFGFFACVAIVLISKFLALFVKRKENYYD